MIDYLKILIFNRELISRLSHNQLLKELSREFKNNLDKEAKEVNQAKYTLVYKEILFCFYAKNDVFTKLEILLKPHYYYNDNIHNANDFSASSCIIILNEIITLFKLPTELPILNIEFGLNLISPIDCEHLIVCAFFHGKNEFMLSNDGLKYSKISFKPTENGKANKYKRIKFYAKSIQLTKDNVPFSKYSDDNLVRFEVKSNEKKYIQTQLGIYSIEDLLKIETYHSLKKILLNELKEVLILDVNTEMQKLTSKEQNKLFKYLHPLTWSHNLQKSKNVFRNEKIKYNNLLDKTGFNIHTEIQRIAENKLNELLKECAISTPLSKKKECAISDVYIIGNLPLFNINRCPITGLNLKHEKEGAKYVRTSTIKYLKKNDKKKYFEVCSLLLNNSKGNRPKYERNIISHLAKQVRNRYFSQYSIKQTGYNRKGYPNQLNFEL